MISHLIDHLACRSLLKVMMNLDLALALLMLVAAIVTFVVNRPCMDAALPVIVAMPFTGRDRPITGL
jgi:hypothetical protein